MQYQFPVIRNISDVLPAIEGRSEFVVAVKDGYTVINYNVMLADTFPPVIEWNEPLNKLAFVEAKHAAIRRECRGIIFDNETGDILRRPYHKFFNVNERPETENAHLYEGHSLLEKLDGSMIAPFFNRGVLVFGTKMGATDVAKPVEEFVNNNPQYIDFSCELIENGFTPIFEWCSRKQRIVLDYPEDRLILTAIRNMEQGSYIINLHNNYPVIVKYNIPIVQSFHSHRSVSGLIEYTRDLQDTEGFVVRFDNGHMVKLKCDWYVQIHKAKERILQDRHIAELILDQKLDDVKAHLPQEERDRLSQFENEISRAIGITQYDINALLWSINKNGISRKDFALDTSQNKLYRSIVFACWDDPFKLYDTIVATIRKSLTSTTKYQELREEWFPGVIYNA